MHPAAGSSFNSPPFDRGTESTLRQLIGLFGAPFAWIVQILLSEPLVAHACYPYQMPLSAPIWDRLPFLLAAISLICLALTLLSGFVAWMSWRSAGRRSAGEMQGRRRQFLGKLSVMSSLIFTIAVLFNICAVSLTSLCSSWF